jgi:protein-disulfide isomerase
MPSAWQRLEDHRVAAFQEWFRAQPRIELDIDESPRAVLLVLFVDYQCPACLSAEAILQEVVDRYQSARPGEVRLVFKDFPLDTTCNDSVPRDVHRAACDAAIAVRLAAKNGHRAAMVQWLGAHLEALTHESIRAGVTETVPSVDFEREYAGLLLDVERDTAQGAALGVRAVPTLFISGVHFRRELDQSLLRAAVDSELGRR